MKKIKVKPSRESSVFGMIVGCIFVIIGFVMVIPSFGLFGILWTGIAAIITVSNVRNVFSEKGIATKEIIIEDDYVKKDTEDVTEKMEKLKELYEKNLITYDEYKTKRKEIIKII